MSAELVKELKKQNASKVGQLLKNQRDNIDVNYIDPKSKKGFLHMAIQNSDSDSLVEILKSSNESNTIDLNLQDNEQNTPLAFAAQLGFSEGVELLLSQKNIEVDFQLDSSDGKTALHAACQTKNNVDIVKQLIKKGADQNAFSKSLGTPLMIAVSESDTDNAIFLLKNRKTDLFLKDANENTCLHRAIIVGFGEFLSELMLVLQDRLQEKIYSAEEIEHFLNSRNNQGNSALHQCVISNRVGAMKLLKSSGVSLGLQLELKNKQNKTADEMIAQAEDSKRAAEIEAAQKKQDQKIEKAAQKEERKRREAEEEAEEQIRQEKEKEKAAKQAESQKVSTFKSILLLFFILAMIAIGVILFLKARNNIQIAASVKAPRTDYDDFL